MRLERLYGYIWSIDKEKEQVRDLQSYKVTQSIDKEKEQVL